LFWHWWLHPNQNRPVEKGITRIEKAIKRKQKVNLEVDEDGNVIDNQK